MATREETAGIAWWNGLTDEAKRYWLERAGGVAKQASAADAWAAYQRDHQQPK